MKAKTLKLQRLTILSILTAVSVMLVSIHFPLIPAVPFLEYDPADIPIVLVTLFFGPLSGFLVTGMASLIQGLTFSAGSGLYGILMHIAATGSYVLAAGVFRRSLGEDRPWKRICIVAAGCIAMTLVMIPANLLITPYFMGTDIQSVKALILPAILPFNLLKAGINSVFALILYPPLSKFLRKEGIL